MKDDLSPTEQLSHYVQAGFLAVIVVACQIRDGRKKDPTHREFEEAAELLRNASATLTPPYGTV
jgi:hypothetical protein